MRRWRSVLAGGVLALATVVQAGITVVAAEPDQSTPDRAARAFVEAFAAQDLDTMLALSSADDRASGHRFAAMAGAVGAWSPTSLAPSEYPFYAAMNRETLRAQLVRQAFGLARSLLTDQDVEAYETIRMSEGQADFFVQDMDPSRLSGLRVLDSRFPDPTWEHEPQTIENWARTSAFAGADERTERLLLVSLDDALYEIGVSLIRYGDRWEVDSLTAIYGQIGSTGAARPTTQEAYERHTSGDYSDLR